MTPLERVTFVGGVSGSDSMSVTTETEASESMDGETEVPLSE